MDKCPLLAKYNITFNETMQGGCNQWYLDICEKHCPWRKAGLCIYMSAETIYLRLSSILKQKQLPCPKCNSGGDWRDVDDDNELKCKYCGIVIYKTKPLSKKIEGDK